MPNSVEYMEVGKVVRPVTIMQRRVYRLITSVHTTSLRGGTSLAEIVTSDRSPDVPIFRYSTTKKLSY